MCRNKCVGQNQGGGSVARTVGLDRNSNVTICRQPIFVGIQQFGAIDGSGTQRPAMMAMQQMVVGGGYMQQAMVMIPGNAPTRKPNRRV